MGRRRDLQRRIRDRRRIELVARSSVARRSRPSTASPGTIRRGNLICQSLLTSFRGPVYPGPWPCKESTNTDSRFAPRDEATGRTSQSGRGVTRLEVLGKDQWIVSRNYEAPPAQDPPHQKTAHQGCARLSTQPRFFAEILDYRSAYITTKTNIEDQMKLSRCQWCPVTASIECMRACLQQRAAEHDPGRLFRRWAWLPPPPRTDIHCSDDDGRRMDARRNAP